MAIEGGGGGGTERKIIKNVPEDNPQCQGRVNHL